MAVSIAGWPMMLIPPASRASSAGERTTSSGTWCVRCGDDQHQNLTQFSHYLRALSPTLRERPPPPLHSLGRCCCLRISHSCCCCSCRCYSTTAANIRSTNTLPSGRVDDDGDNNNNNDIQDSPAARSWYACRLGVVKHHGALTLALSCALFVLRVTSSGESFVRVVVVVVFFFHCCCTTHGFIKWIPK